MTGIWEARLKTQPSHLSEEKGASGRGSPVTGAQLAFERPKLGDLAHRCKISKNAKNPKLNVYYGVD